MLNIQQILTETYRDSMLAICSELKVFDKLSEQTEDDTDFLEPDNWYETTTEQDNKRDKGAL